MLDNFEKIEFFKQSINDSLEKYIPKDNKLITEAMRYSLFAGGKRIRPILTLAFCEACSSDYIIALPFGCSVEMIHTYSLIFDDLPCMDNDILRRGKPTNHMIYGENISLMAGSSLYSLAIDIILNASVEKLSINQIIEGLKILISASGKDGIIQGQVLDILNIDKKILLQNELENIYELKTVALIEASVLLGCLAAQVDMKYYEAASVYAKNIGMAFQIRDDILDVVGDVNFVGKSVGKDIKENKVTFVDLLGVEGSQNKVDEYINNAIGSLEIFNNNDFLIYLTKSLCNRNK